MFKVILILIFGPFLQLFAETAPFAIEHWQPEAVVMGSAAARGAGSMWANPAMIADSGISLESVWGSWLEETSVTQLSMSAPLHEGHFFFRYRDQSV